MTNEDSRPKGIRPIEVELLTRRGGRFCPSTASEFEAGVHALVHNMYRNSAERPPIKVVWSKQCILGDKNTQADVVIKLKNHNLAGISPRAAVDFWIRMVGSWSRMAPYFFIFRLGIVIMDESGQTIVRLGRSAVRNFSSTSIEKS